MRRIVGALALALAASLAVPLATTSPAGAAVRIPVAASDHDHHHHRHTMPPQRIRALRWAHAQRGKPYEWGGTGPYAFDCSGLVMEAYRHAGIHLPRTTWEMEGSRKLIRIWRHPQKGDLIFFFGGAHVELFQSGGMDGGVAFGAHMYGDPAGFDHWSTQWDGAVAIYRVRHAG